MKRYIYSSSAEKVYNTFYVKGSKKEYRFSGVVDEDLGFAYGDISVIAPYDDADYYWARIEKDGLVKYVQGTKVKQKDQLFYYEDSDKYEDYENASEYIDYIINSVAEKLAELNKDIRPVMVHN